MEETHIKNIVSLHITIRNFVESILFWTRYRIVGFHIVIHPIESPSPVFSFLIEYNSGIVSDSIQCYLSNRIPFSCILNFVSLEKKETRV